MMKNEANFNRALVELSHAVIDNDNTKIDAKTLLEKGIIFVDDKGPIEEIGKSTAEIVEKHFGYKADQWNKQFQSSWNKVATAPDAQLIWEQLMHYASTYGMKAMGLTQNPFIPVKDVFAQLKDDKSKFTVIKVVSEKEGILLAEDYLKTVQKPNQNNMTYISSFTDEVTMKVDEIKSFEVKCIYCNQHECSPSDPQDLLRYLIYITTGSTLVIKNKATIDAIKSALASPDYNYNYATRNIGANSKAADQVHKILENADLVELSTIFLRNKALFLALKADKRNAPIINKIRRLAVTNHKPLSEVTIANVMNLLAQNKRAEISGLLKRTSNRNLIKLINYCDAVYNSDERIFNIRNGKVYITTRTVNKKNVGWLQATCINQLSENLDGKLKGKTFFIPDGVSYAAPISEKQMLGNIPFGTTMNADPDGEGLCVSIAWDNYCGEQTDIDLHLNSSTKSYGWNSSYRSDDRDVMYSGDMTDATHGATETFRIANTGTDTFIASVNLYSHGGDGKVPFKVFLSNADDFKDRDDGMVDISKALTTPIDLRFDGETCRDMTIGYVNGTTFTVYGGNLGHSIVPKRDLYADALKAIVNRCKSMMTIAEIIEMSGGTIVNELPEEETDVVDLSPENITETIIFKMVDGE